MQSVITKQYGFRGGSWARGLCWLIGGELARPAPADGRV